MRRLTLASCRPLALGILPRICREGLVEPFRSWRHPAADSLLQGLEDGKEFHDALRGMSPRLPAALEELLVLGASRGILDHVAEDVRDAFRRGTGLGPLRRKYRRLPPALCLSERCLSRDTAKLFRRARVEGASEVVLKPDGEQVYLGVKPVRVIEEGQARLHAALQGRRHLRRGKTTLRLTFPEPAQSQRRTRRR